MYCGRHIIDEFNRIFYTENAHTQTHGEKRTVFVDWSEGFAGIMNDYEIQVKRERERETCLSCVV